MKPNVVLALENAGWPALLIDVAGGICGANRAAISLFGQAVEGAGTRLGSIWAPDNSVPAEQFPTHWERSPVPTLMLKYRSKEGSLLSFLTSVSAFSSESEKFYILQLIPQSTETALASRQRLDCALQLARTVSLDFNNALTSILGHASLLLAKAEPGHPWREALLEITKSAEKAGDLADDLATFSRQEKEVRSQLASNLNTVLQRSIDAVQQVSVAKKLSWTVTLERHAFAVKCDEAKLQQAFIKLLDNAVEAAEPGGSITAQTRNLETTKEIEDGTAKLMPGTYLCVEIFDDGAGIPPDVLPRIFDPFFTTKPNHRGLGLALAYGIITNHRGGIGISSQPGAGTSARVYLPAEKRMVKESKEAGELRGGETILVVDDEELLLTLQRTVLSSFGYEVLTANNGHKALEILSGRKEDVHLVITDMVMPGMSGRELAERIRAQWPAVRVLRTSGYSPNSVEEDDPAYLKKPFNSRDLLAKVREVLTLASS